MCRYTDDPDDLCHLCYEGGCCWKHMPVRPSLPVEEPAHLLEEELTGWDWIWMHPESIMYWTASGCRPLALARARVYVRGETS